MFIGLLQLCSVIYCPNVHQFIAQLSICLLLKCALVYSTTIHLFIVLLFFGLLQLCDDGTNKQIYEVSEPSTPVRFVPNGTPKKTPLNITPNGSPNMTYNLRKRDKSYTNGHI